MKPFPTLRDVAHDMVDNKTLNIITIDRISLSVLAVQAALFAYLKKENYLFGEHLIGRTKKNWYGPFVSMSLVWAGFSAYMRTGLFGCVCSDVSSEIAMLLMSSSLVHLSNLIYDDALELLRERSKDFRPIVIFKNSLNNVQCISCYDDAVHGGCVNICTNHDHWLCKECLVNCFALRKEKLSLARLWCEWCRKNVPYNDQKIEVVLPNEKVTLGLWTRQVGVMWALYWMGLNAIIDLLQCYCL
jgi:hypothetical protein